jgi:hypothetical protein
MRGSLRNPMLLSHADRRRTAWLRSTRFATRACVTCLSSARPILSLVPGSIVPHTSLCPTFRRRRVSLQDNTTAMVADGREDGTLANRHGRRRQRPDSREAAAEITITSSHLEPNILIWRIKFAWCVFPIWLKIHYICNWWSTIYLLLYKLLPQIFRCSKAAPYTCISEKGKLNFFRTFIFLSEQSHFFNASIHWTIWLQHIHWSRIACAL